MNNPKVILMHPGKQHSFRVASALKQSGLLYKYITTVYDKEDSIMMKLVKKFLEAEADDRDLLLYLWGHSYEMDYGKGAASWDGLERLFAAVAGREDIIYCTNSEAFLRI